MRDDGGWQLPPIGHPWPSHCCSQRCTDVDAADATSSRLLQLTGGRSTTNVEMRNHASIGKSLSFFPAVQPTYTVPGNQLKVCGRVFQQTVAGTR